MLRRSLVPLASSSAGPKKTGIPQRCDYVVIGGGVAGCVVAGLLHAEKHNVVMIESGPDLEKAPLWHTQMPAAPLVHRAKGRYIKKINLAKPVNFTMEINNPEKGDLKEERAFTTSHMEAPQVIGGAGTVLGNRTWVRGHVGDWADFPLDWNNDVLKMFCRIEHWPGLDIHRGLRGKFATRKPTFLNQLHRPVLDAYVRTGLPLIQDFNTHTGFDGCGAGRPEVMIDANTGEALSSYNQYVKNSVLFHSVCNTDAIGINFGDKKEGLDTPQNGAVARSVRVREKGSDKIHEIECGHVIVCAGALQTPVILQNSENLPQEAGSDIGKNLWTTPMCTLQYACHLPISLSPIADRGVQLMTYCSWHFRRMGWAMSAMDDMVMYLAPGTMREPTPLKKLVDENDPLAKYHEGPKAMRPESPYEMDNSNANYREQRVAYPTVKVMFQPFMTDDQGKVINKQGFQFVVQLIRPHSRGQVNPDGSVEPNCFSDASDLATLQEAITVVNNAVKAELRPSYTYAECIGHRLELRGAVGGTVPMGGPVEASTLRLKGAANVQVCDGSVVPRGLVIDPVPLAITLGEHCCEGLITKMPPNRFKL